MRRPAPLLHGLLWASVLGALLFAAVPAGAEPMRLEVVELHTRSAEEVIALLRPMLAPGGTITGAGDTLVIRTTPGNFADLRRILDTVDAPPRRLLITVRRDSTAHRDSRDVEVSGSVGGSDGQITVPDSGNGEQRSDGAVRLRARAAVSERADAASMLQSVQVIEGRAAFFRFGESVPIRSSGPQGSDAVQYRDVVIGFYALARLRGDQVRIELASSADTLLDRDTGTAAIRRTVTVVTGSLGEWLEIDAVETQTDALQSGTVYNRGAASRHSSRSYIKVEEM